MKIIKKISIWQIVPSIIFVVIGCFLLNAIPWFKSYTFDVIRTLKPDGIIFRSWQTYPPMYFRFYLFNWTNPEDVYNLNVKPRLEEVGPFVFKHTMEKVNISWNSNNTVSYRQLRYWYFDEAKSIANLTIKIVTFNSGVIGMAHRVRHSHYILQKTIDFLIRSASQKMYVEKTVGEILFHGYDDFAISTMKMLPLPKDYFIPSVRDKMAWFYMRNGSYTYDGTFTAETSRENFGKLQQWNYKSAVPYYSGACNRIKGSANEFYPIPLSRDKLEIFWADICRSISANFVEDTSFHGTKSYKYNAGRNFFDNGSKIVENKCFLKGEDLRSGVFNVSACWYEAPLFVSLPHFYGADSYYINQVEGLNPNEEKHDSTLIAEPTTGVTLYIKARFQVNLLLQPTKYISMFRRVPKIYLPVFWVEHERELPTFYHFLLNAYLNQKAILMTSAIISLLVGFGLFVSGLSGQLLKRQKSKRTQIILENEDVKQSLVSQPEDDTKIVQT